MEKRSKEKDGRKERENDEKMKEEKQNNTRAITKCGQTS